MSCACRSRADRPHRDVSRRRAQSTKYVQSGLETKYIFWMAFLFIAALFLGGYFVLMAGYNWATQRAEKQGGRRVLLFTPFIATKGSMGRFKVQKDSSNRQGSFV